jgi:polyvinyl alcohol dehydrogenase (cytochrome)
MCIYSEGEHVKRMPGSRWFVRMSIVGSAALAITAATSADAVTSTTDWPAYLNGPAHNSYAKRQTAITPTTTVTSKWHVSDSFLSSPVVADGAVFVGSFQGNFYKINATTGMVENKIFMGFTNSTHCGNFGFATVATVARDPSRGEDVLYVAAPDGFLHALSVATMTQLWQSRIIPTPGNAYFQWSSPTVVKGKIYVGISSNCDIPLVRAGVAGFSQTTGKRFATFYTVPKGHLGGSVWSTPAVNSTGNVYITTGNGFTRANIYLTDSIVKLSPKLTKLGSWTVPAGPNIGGDDDFGASPTLFSARIHGRTTPMVGACNKNGIYYALNARTMRLVWKARIGATANGQTQAACLAAAAFDGKHLFMGGTGITIGGKAFKGSVVELNPATGKVLWRQGTNAAVIASPSLDGKGVLAAGTFSMGHVTCSTCAAYLFNASNGHVLQTLVTGTGTDAGQAVFANGWVYVTEAFGTAQGVYAFGP